MTGQLWRMARAGRWSEFYDTLAYSAHERYYEWRLGVQSSGFTSAQELGMPNDLFHSYQPTEYRTLRAVFRRLSLDEDDVLLDLGAGKGRVCIMAARQPLRSALGLEISPQLVAAAVENVRRVLPKLRCHDVRIFEGDATVFPIPAEVSIVYMANPFRGAALFQVIGNVEASLARRERPLRIVFLHPYSVEIEDHRSRFPWLMQMDEFSPPGALRVAVYGNEAAVTRAHGGRRNKALSMSA